MKKLGIIVLLIVQAVVVQAIDLPPFYQRIEQSMGIPASVGDNETTAVTPYTGTLSYVDNNFRDYLTLGINHQFEAYLDRYELKVGIEITDNLTSTTQIKYLEIVHEPFSVKSNTDKQTYSFTGLKDYTFEIISIELDGVSVNDLPLNAYVEGTILANRELNFNSQVNVSAGPVLPTLVDYDCDGMEDQLRLNWSSVEGALEYQLEWVFVNDYNGVGGYLLATQLEYDFRNNSTRITTVETSYEIPMIFDHGYIIYRVRAVGKDYNNLDRYLFGAWSEVESGQVSSATDKLQNLNPHEVGKNWQLTTTFAEEGKKKEVVSYYDGSLRNRQSVTRINTDQSTIVGETVYDNQGRPAVNILPVPVERPNCGGTDDQASLKFYPKFNQDGSGNEYNKNNFDQDAGTCATAADPLATTTGASRYYSENNPEQDAFQKNVPDAEGYPMTQIEYTPDNTGRIRRQSGVGDGFQLGTNHETKYFYGKPQQIKLNRLFGTEVGLAGHYKKNLVIDPNGQISVSYLDQEGRVIATSLAGEETPNLEAISSLADAEVELTSDLLEEDPNGNSYVNAANINNNGFNYYSELLVSTASTYDFVYDLAIAEFQDECLAPNICFHCVYDLEIKVIDDCGNELDLLTPGGGSIAQSTGQFIDTDNDKIADEFVSTCINAGTGQYNNQISFQAYLTPGSYTLVKNLTLSNAALDQYLTWYLDENYNSCILPFSYFEDSLHALVDTSDCAIDCEDCVASLGEKDDFVSQGLGTAEEYDALVEACLEPCRVPTRCEVAYDMMLADVSPQGIYGYYLDGNNQPYNNYASVFFEGNQLNSNSSPQQDANWRHPVFTDENGTTTYHYYNDDNTLTKIYLLDDGLGNITPAIAGTAVVKTDGTGDYVYPEELADRLDFINLWQDSWAKSLVQHHPEWCYYEACQSYGNEDANGNSSKSFDQLLYGTLSFDAALNDNDLLIPSGSGYTINDWLFASTSHPYDPFAAALPGTSDLHTKVNTYVTIGGTPYDMVEAAAIVARCGNAVLNSTSIPVGCTHFGEDVVGNTPAENTTLHNTEWETLRSFYISAKQASQISYEQSYAESNDCHCDCIGDEDYNPFTANLPYSGGITGWSTYILEVLNDKHCGLAGGKVNFMKTRPRRFGSGETALPDEISQDALEYQTYLQTGQCPVALYLQGTLSELAQSGELTNSTVNLANYQNYSMLYLELAANNSLPIPANSWDILANSGGILIAEFTHPQTAQSCQITFNGGSQVPDWTQVVGFTGLDATGVNGSGDYTFNVVVKINDGMGGLTYETITGTTCLNIETCQFDDVCTTNELGENVEQLLSFLALNGDLTGAGVSLGSATYSPYLGLPLVNTVGGNTATMQFSFNGTNQFTINNTSGTEVYTLNILSSSPSFTAFGSIAYFSNLVSDYQHYFVVDAFDASGTFLTTFRMESLINNGSGNAGLALGSCGLPTPLECTSLEHETLNGLQAILEDMLPQTGSNGNLYTSSAMTTLLQNQLPSGAMSSQVSSSTTNGSGGFDNTTTYLIQNAIGEECEITLNAPSAEALDFGDLISMELMVAEGPIANNSFMEFSFEATFNTTSGPITTTVYGSSCLSLKNCDVCPPDAGDAEPPTNQQQALLNKQASYDSTLYMYDDYVQSVDNFNTTQGFVQGTPQYLSAVDYDYFANMGLCCVAGTYTDYLDNYIPGIDDSVWVYNIDSFRLDYGYATNVNEEYNRYLSSVDSYNQRAISVGLSGMQAIDDSAFLYDMYAGINKDYVAKLELYPQAGQTSPTIKTFAASANVGGDPNCEALYKQYLEAYDYFKNNNLNKKCIEFTKLYDFSVVEKNGLCCSPGGPLLFQAYINSLYNNNKCPGELPKYDCVKNDPEEDIRECQLQFEQYLVLIKTYNQSAYAQANNHSLTPVVSNFDEFIKNGYCNCILAYMEYLTPYLKANGSSTLQIPVSLKEFGDCNPQILSEDCKEQYSVYLSTVRNYNSYAKPLGLPIINTQYNYEMFTEEMLCGCVEAFSSYMQALISGAIEQPATQEEWDEVLDIAYHCSMPPCEPEVIVQDTIESFTIEYTNPCVEQLFASATENAEILYEEYINGISADFIDRYTQHCMGVNEDFIAKYTDKEYHFTLYYYDQAGNLVKTIPPEGVEQLDITSDSDPLSLQIAQDRLNNTQTVFTNHRMATRYQYNSLNQLVKQSLPDHDQMEVWEYTLPNGLDSKLVITSIQYQSSSQGFLTGYKNVGANQRGYIYETNDGGKTWSKVYNTVAASINKIKWANSSQALAIGDNGTILRSTDGGMNWDMVSFFNQNVIEDLYDMAFNGSGGGIIVGESARILEISGGSATPVSPTFTDPVYALTNNDEIKAVVYENGLYFMAANRNVAGNITGMVYRSSTPAGPWTAMSHGRLNQFDHVQVIDAVRGIAVGASGELLVTENNGQDWYIQPSENVNIIRDVYFKNANEGIAIIEEGGIGQIMKTFDGGFSWDPVDPLNTNDYVAIHPYLDAPLGYGSKVIAVGNAGAAARIIMENGTPFGMIDISGASTVDYNSVWAGYVGSNLYVLAGTNNGVYKNPDAESSSTWTTAGASGNNIKNIQATVVGSLIKGIFVTTANEAKQFQVSAGILAAVSNVSTSPPSTEYTAVTTDPASNDIYVYDNQNNALHKFDMLAGTVTNTGSVDGFSSSLSLAKDIHFKGPGIIIGGTKGSISSGVPGIWNEGSNNIRPLEYTDISRLNSTTVFAVGACGNITRLSNSGGTLLLSINTPRLSTNNWNATAIKTDDVGILVGDNGVINGFQYLGTGFNFINVPSVTGDDLLDVAYNSVNDRMEIAAENGNAYSVSNTPSISVTSILNNNNNNFNSVGVSPSGTVLLGGDFSKIYLGNSSSAVHIKNVYTPPMQDIHFVDLQNGYAVGDNYTVRHTSNGGMSWEMVMPDTDFSSGVPELNNVHTTAINQAFIVGEDKYLAKISSVTASTASITVSGSLAATIDFNDIDFASNSTGYIVGGQPGTATALKTSNGGATWNSVLTAGVNNELNALYVFDDNETFFAVGDASNAAYYNGVGLSTAAINLPAVSVALNDVYFHDNINGYIVGDNGTIWRSQNGNITGTNNILTGIDFVVRPTTDGLNSQLTETAKNINTIDFASRYEGFVGGEYTATGPVNYARILQDETQEFSTYFWYDKLGRIVVSQNSWQYNTGTAPKRYSYTLYDELGRVVESGEKYENASGDLFASIFGTTVSGHYNPNVIDDANLLAWIENTAGIREEVTHTFYDIVDVDIATELTLYTGSFNQENLRKRIATVAYYDQYDDVTFPLGYSHATHYTYDVHGNVNTLLQDNNLVPELSQRFKRMDYEYDLISGNVHNVVYQKEEADQWIHHYDYDADNRIVDVETSEDGFIFDNDARYFYYAHGPLARIEAGENNVQGTDYAYTLQGWLKGVNSDVLNPVNDMGNDGDGNTSNPNGMFARDAMGFSLGYYDGDYKAIDPTWTTTPTERFVAQTTGSDLEANRENLYNGNIGHMVTTIVEPALYTYAGNEAPTAKPQGTAYHYDQLNRLVEATAWQNLNTLTNEWGTGVSYNGMYHNTFEYDANGNILAQTRKDHVGAFIDELEYHYAKDANGNRIQNRLYHVNDSYDYNGGDIDDMGAFDANLSTINSNNNYSFDGIGQLTRDAQEEIANIEWRVDGKIRDIVRNVGSGKKNLRFDYDAMGNRIAKHQYEANGIDIANSNWEKSTYYSLDVRGKIIAIYEYVNDMNNNEITYKLNERNIHGAGRIGMYTKEVDMLVVSTDINDHELGARQYECSNHLGNVLAVISDKKIPRDDNTDLIIDYYEPAVLNTFDYSPFGVLLEERNHTAQVCEEQTMFALQNDFNDGTTQGFSAMSSSSQVGNSSNRLAVKKSGGGGTVGVSQSFTVQTGTLYNFTAEVDKGDCNPSSSIAVRIKNDLGVVIASSNVTASGITTVSLSFTASSMANYSVEFERVGNSSTCKFYIDNISIDYLGEVCMDYSVYRYGFNGMERDDNFKGAGNSYTTPFRQYDSRLGRWLTIDPATAKYPHQSPYAAYNNNPVLYKDPSGLEGEPTSHTVQKGETLSGLAKKYGVTQQEIIDANSGDNGNAWDSKDRSKKWLYEGEVLNIPSKAEESQPEVSISGTAFMNYFTITVFVEDAIEAESINVIQIVANTPVSSSTSTMYESYGPQYDDEGFLESAYRFTGKDGKEYGAEVDGGVNSFYAQTLDPSTGVAFGPTVPGSPYYIDPSSSSDPNNWVSFDGSIGEGSLRLTDSPSTYDDQEVELFTVIIVATNYMGSGNDLILGVLSWGFTDYGKTNLHGNNIPNATKELPPNTMEIINHFYPNYEFYNK